MDIDIFNSKVLHSPQDRLGEIVNNCRGISPTIRTKSCSLIVVASNFKRDNKQDRYNQNNQYCILSTAASNIRRAPTWIAKMTGTYWKMIDIEIASGVLEWQVACFFVGDSDPAGRSPTPSSTRTHPFVPAALRALCELRSTWTMRWSHSTAEEEMPFGIGLRHGRPTVEAVDEAEAARSC